MYHNDPIIRDLEVMSDAVRYNDWLFSQFRPFLGNRILEVGAGIGNFTEKLLDREHVVATDVYEPCVLYLEKRFSRNANVYPLFRDISSDDIADLRQHNFDTILCMNVLEHIRDDQAALDTLFTLTRDRGKLLLLVPAFPVLFGTIDRMVGHHRRYTKNVLVRKCAQSGFQIRSAYYMNWPAFLGWFVNNRLLMNREESSRQVKFYDSLIIPWLRVLEGIIHPPFGLSIVLVAEKI